MRNAVEINGAGHFPVSFLIVLVRGCQQCRCRAVVMKNPLNGIGNERRIGQGELETVAFAGARVAEIADFVIEHEGRKVRQGNAYFIEIFRTSEGKVIGAIKARRTRKIWLLDHVNVQYTIICPN